MFPLPSVLLAKLRNTMKNITLKAFASVAALAVAAGSPAIAQQAAAPQQAAPQIAPVTDAEVTQFVAANGKVATIATEMNSKLEGVETQEKAAEIQMGAEKKMVAAIQAEGLSPQRYTEIIRLAQVDGELNQKLRAEMEG
ncbi:MAG: hypothetical protein CMK06_00275 [Ponticaulis sp.]|nr:hypothetical protein [Ponticaulis sp.]|tara:strand:- start:97 stop:516 length:420 start_codon:yes stop_codon:yes gene_type:complete